MYSVLVVDDNQDYRADMMEMLGFERYDTLGAENGLIGLQMIRQYVPDLIICDVDMPVMDGIQLLRKVKADLMYAAIPFIIVTGRSDDLTLQTARDLGADMYLTKPFAIAEFLAVITSLLLENKTLM